MHFVLALLSVPLTLFYVEGFFYPHPREQYPCQQHKPTHKVFFFGGPFFWLSVRSSTSCDSELGMIFQIC